jgi:cobalamin biosynthesis Mg chelatase CobN
MARRTTIALAAACGLALSLLPASSALAGSAFDEVLKDYQGDGQIDACAHSDKTLQDAQHQIPNDIEQYAPDFPDALKEALRQRAGGQCDKKSSGNTGTVQSASGTSGSSGSGSGSSSSGGGSSASQPAAAKPKAGAPPTPPPVVTPVGGQLAASVPAAAAASTAGTPLPIILLAILGGLLLLAGLFALLARFMGWGFERFERPWHTMREAGYRTEETASEFADWVRFGR